MPRILHLWQRRSDDQVVYIGFTKARWTVLDLRQWCREARLAFSAKKEQHLIGTARTNSFKRLKSAVKTHPISPAVKYYPMFPDFQAIRQESGLQPLWKEGVALRFPDFKERSPCITCCADPQCKALGEDKWIEAHSVECFSEVYDTLDCAEVELAIRIRRLLAERQEAPGLP